MTEKQYQRIRPISKARISPDEFTEVVRRVGLNATQFRDLFNKSDAGFRGYKTGKRSNGKAYTEPTVSETLVMDLISAHPDVIPLLLELAKKRIRED